MSTLSEDVELLISRLAGPLSPHDRIAFRRAAEDAVSRVPCLGEGAIYRTLVSIQRGYFNPPADTRAYWDVQHGIRPTKLKSAPAIEFAGDGRAARYRKQR